MSVDSRLITDPPTTPDRRLDRWMLGTLAMVALLVSLLPRVLSIPRVHQAVLTQVPLSDFRLSFDAADSSWWHPLRLTGLSVRKADDPADAPALLRVNRITCQQGLLDASWWRDDPGWDRGAAGSPGSTAEASDAGTTRS